MKIETVEQLDALAVGTVILLSEKTAAQKEDDQRWYVASDLSAGLSGEQLITYLPAEVIYPIEFNNATFNRFEVIDNRSPSGQRGWLREIIIDPRGPRGKVWTSIQDQGRTLKVFLENEES